MRCLASFIFAVVISVAAALLLCAAGTTRAQAQPKPWPPVHTHRETEWDLTSGPPQNGHSKFFYYNFPMLQMRVDSKYAFGNALLQSQTLTSYWLNKTLSMFITFDIFGNVSSTCQQLDMGFGMMTPTWFLSSPGDDVVNGGSLFLTQRHNPFDNNYRNVTWFAKGSPDGPFNYFFDSATGEGFSMFAPSPMGEVENEYADFQTVAGGPNGFPAGTFVLPAQCNSKVLRKDQEELFFAEIYRHIVRNHGAALNDKEIDSLMRVHKMHLHELKFRGQQNRKF